MHVLTKIFMTLSVDLISSELSATFCLLELAYWNM